MSERFTLDLKQKFQERQGVLGFLLLIFGVNDSYNKGDASGNRIWTFVFARNRDGDFAGLRDPDEGGSG